MTDNRITAAPNAAPVCGTCGTTQTTRSTPAAPTTQAAHEPSSDAKAPGACIGVGTLLMLMGWVPRIGRFVFLGGVAIFAFGIVLASRKSSAARCPTCQPVSAGAS